MLLKKCTNFTQKYFLFLDLMTLKVPGKSKSKIHTPKTIINHHRSWLTSFKNCSNSASKSRLLPLNWSFKFCQRLDISVFYSWQKISWFSEVKEGDIFVNKTKCFPPFWNCPRLTLGDQAFDPSWAWTRLKDSKMASKYPHGPNPEQESLAYLVRWMMFVISITLNEYDEMLYYIAV